jgi:hypothetical protein
MPRDCCRPDGSQDAAMWPTERFASTWPTPPAPLNC